MNRETEPPRQTPPAPREQPVDVGAMIARMRRMREERERAQAEERASAPVAPSEPVALRFKRGLRVTCVPYGEGVVQASRAVAGRERVTISFPEHGAIEVDPAVSVVRLVDDAPADSGEARYGDD